MRLMRWLRGWVRFQVEAPHGGERFLNSCTRAGLCLWGLRPGQNGLTACVRAGQYAALRMPARRAGVRLRVKKRCGLPFRTAHLCGRPGLYLGSTLFAVILLGLGQCFWTVEISGCRTVPEAALRAALAQQGVAPGALRQGFFAPTVQARLMQRFPQISWVSVNDHGCDADVQLTEKDDTPRVADQTGWYQLQATQSGTVVEMHINAGTAKVKVGDGIAKGQLLVSPVVEDKEQKFLELRHASGMVLAQTSHTLTVTVPYRYTQRQAAGTAVQRWGIEAFGVRLPLSWRLPPAGTVMRSGETTSLRLCGRTLPLCVVREELTPVCVCQKIYTRQQAQQRAARLLDGQEKTSLPGAAVVHRRDSARPEKTGVTVTRTLLCRENVAKEVKVSG